MKSKLKTLSALALVCGNLFAFSQAAQAKKDDATFPVCSFQPTVGVGEFNTENLFMGSSEAAINMRDELVNQLVNSGCYKVVERGRTGIVSGGYDREQSIKAVGAARKGQKAARSGQVTLADKIVNCALTAVSKDNMGGGISGLGAGRLGGGFGGGGLGAKSSKIEMTCRIYDSSSSEIIASASNSESKVDMEVSAAGGGALSFVGGNFFNNTPLGKTIRKLIAKNLIDMTKKVQANPWS